jgi:Leucine-rich repeat (LRR) protein
MRTQKLDYGHLFRNRSVLLLPLLLLLSAGPSPAQDDPSRTETVKLKSDDLEIVRGILDANGWKTVAAKDVAIVRDGRVVELDLRGEFMEVRRKPEGMTITPSFYYYLFISTLPESIGRLTALERLDLGGHQVHQLPASLGQLTRLKFLNLNPRGYKNQQKLMYYGTRVYHEKQALEVAYEKSGRLAEAKNFLPGAWLRRLPAELAALTQLETLDLSNNRLETFPEWVGGCGALRVLRLENMALQDLPSCVLKLKRLETLDLSHNSLRQLPGGIGDLSRLADLDLQGNGLEAVPEAMGGLVGLQRLDLSHNAMAALPESIGNFGKMTDLEVHHNRLQTLPGGIGKLTALRRLALNRNRLRELPASLGDLAALEELYLQENQIAALPPSCGKLVKLRILHIMYNRLTALPETIGNLGALEVLFCYFNELEALPASVGNLKALQRLEADENRLTALPDTLGQMDALQHFHVDNNRLTALPAQIGKRLDALRASGNRLTVLPDTLKADTIVARSNRLKAIPDEILTSVGSLDLTHNEVESIPAAIGRTKRLRLLKLGGNRLSAIPAEIATADGLRILALENNRITAIPEAVGSMKNLVQLDVRDNQIETVPASLADLGKLVGFVAANNRLATLPEALFTGKGNAYLHLEHNALTPEGLPPAVARYKGMIDVAYNHLTPLGSDIKKRLKGTLQQYRPDANPPSSSGKVVRPQEKAPRVALPADPGRGPLPIPENWQARAVQKTDSVYCRRLQALIADVGPRIEKLDADNPLVARYLPRLREKLMVAYVACIPDGSPMAQINMMFAGIALEGYFAFFLDKLERKLDPDLYLPGAILGSAFLASDGSVSAYQYTVPRSYDPKHPQAFMGMCQVMGAPDLYVNSPYINMFQMNYLVTEVLQQAVLDLAKDVHIDPFRVYLTSHSQGGELVYQAAWRYPQTWAAVATASCDVRTPSRYNRFWQAKYAGGPPVRITVGDRDDFTECCKEVYQELRNKGAIVDWGSWNGDHGQIVFSQPSIYQMITDHFDKWTLYPYPGRIVHLVEDTLTTRAYWANAYLNREYDRREDLGETWFCVRADKAANTIMIEHASDRISGFEFHLNAALLDLGKPVTVVESAGKTLYQGPAPAGGLLMVKRYDKDSIPASLPVYDRAADYISEADPRVLWEKLQEIQKRRFGQTSPVPARARLGE